MSASDVELDMYRELTNIGGGNAATALSQMINQKVDLGLPTSQELSIADIEHVVGDGEGEVAVTLITVRGDLAGSMALVVADPPALSEALGVPDEYLDSALAEIGNIVASRFLISIGEMIMIEGEVEPPAVGFAPRKAALQTVVALAAQSEPFYVLRLDLTIGEDGTPNEILYFPSEGTISRLRGLC